ncbi:MAG: methyltransferase [Bacillota bacterium]|nr:methyltransferase [Bacillota bacterium]
MSRTIDVRLTLAGRELAFRVETEPELFSPRYPDPGSLAMLGQLDLAHLDGPVLDLGCGYGLVGLAVAQLIDPALVTLTDVDPLALATARRNAAALGLEGLRVLESDAFQGLEGAEGFACILSNPPYHADFAVPKRFIAGAWRHLRPGGHLYMVTKRRTWYARRLEAVFGGFSLRLVDDYTVFVTEKRVRDPARRRPAAGRRG